MFGTAIARGLLAVGVACYAIAAQAVTIDLVTIGNAGNAADVYYQTAPYREIVCGAVDHDYQIGKYEVTAGQYCEFLNAKAKSDPYELYRTEMADPIGSKGCNIQRSGGSGSYSYSVASDWANRPVNNVSFWSAARFSNWLNNGQGTGDTETGAYTLNGITDGTGETIARNAGAKWFLPSEDEWYKAAYHKNDGVTGNYWDYTTGTDVVPGRDMNELTNSGNNANYNSNGTYLIGDPYYRTPVGEFELSDSAYGTFDQGGNVSEWTETLYDDQYNTPINRIVRGGSFGDSSLLITASGRMDIIPWSGSPWLGFRVACVPEPGSMVMLVVGALWLLAYGWRWQRKAHALSSMVLAVVIGGLAANGAMADTFGTEENQFSIDFVSISGATNPTSGYGVVNDDYRMGNFEVTNDQWNKFLANLGVAVTGDPGFSSSFLGTNQPTDGVSWYEAAQFVNWLNTSTGHQAAYKFTGTQGTSDYTFATWDAAEASGGTNLFRHKNAFYFLPTEDEWVKAAYWNGTELQNYATKESETLFQGNGANGGWNYYDGDVGPDGPDSRPWNVGSGSEELNGTHDMMGNLSEWIESPYSNQDYGSDSLRVMRGGDWMHGSSSLVASYRFYGEPSKDLYYGLGFRVASVPEPGSITMMLGIALTALLCWWRRRA